MELLYRLVRLTGVEIGEILGVHYSQQVRVEAFKG